jgi:hypothetical protein
VHAAPAPPATAAVAGLPTLPKTDAGGHSVLVVCQVCRKQVPGNALGQCNKFFKVCRPCLSAAASNPKGVVLPHCPRVNCHEQNVRLVPGGYHSSGGTSHAHWIEFRNGEFVSHRPKPKRLSQKRSAAGSAGVRGKAKKSRFAGLL